MRKGVGFADVKEPKVVLDISYYVATDTFFKVEIDDAEFHWEAVHRPEQARRNDVYTGKGEFSAFIRVEPGVWTLHFASLSVGPTHKAQVIIEEKIALRLALTDKQDGIRRAAGLFTLEGNAIEFAEV